MFWSYRYGHIASVDWGWPGDEGTAEDAVAHMAMVYPDVIYFCAELVMN